MRKIDEYANKPTKLLRIELLLITRKPDAVAA